MTKEKERRFIILLSIFEIGGEGTKKKVLDNISINNYAYFSKRVHIPVKPTSNSGNNRPPNRNNKTGQHIVH
jgi:hypothetical protein